MLSSLRLLHVTPYFEGASAYGGIPRVVTTVTRELARRGHAVTVCTTDVMSARERLPRPTGDSGRTSLDHAAAVTVHLFRNVSNRLAHDWQLFLPRGMGEFLRQHAGQFDVAHLHACRNLPGVMAARALTRAGVPYVLSPHGTAPLLERRRAAKWLFDRSLGRGVVSHAARVLAVSDAERRALEQTGIADDRIRVIANPIDLAEFEQPIARGVFRQHHQIGNAPLVMFLGKLTPRKRLDVLARAFAELARPNARLVIAGDDMGEGARIRRLVAALGIAARTTFTGLLTGRDRLHALADADVVTYASEDEVFGLVPLEALLCGTPVIVGDDSGCGEIVRQLGVGGVAVPPGDASSLARAIGTILDVPERWRAGAVIAQSAIRQSYSPSRICDDLEVVYRDVVGS